MQKFFQLAPPAGIEPTFQEPESCVLSITPRGHLLNDKVYYNPIPKKMQLQFVKNKF